MYKIFNILIFIFISFTASAKESPLKITQTLPSSIGSMLGDPIKSYKNETLGVSKGYNYKTDNIHICATVYVFDMGAKHIASGIDSDYVKKAYQYAKIDVRFYEKKGAYKNVVLLEETIHKTPVTENKTALSLRAKYKYIKQKPNCGTNVTSYIHVFAAHSHFIKIRLTMSFENKDSESIKDHFIDSIIATLAD